MTFQDLSIATKRRCEEVFHPIDKWSPNDWGVAMAGEAGEVCNALKKLRRIETGGNTSKDPQTKEDAISDIAKELADTVIYCDLLATRLGISLESSIVNKFNEVSRLINSKERLF